LCDYREFGESFGDFLISQITGIYTCKTNFSEIFLAIYFFILFIRETTRFVPYKNQCSKPLFFILFYFRDKKNFSFFSFFLDKKFGIFGFSKLDSTNFAIYFGEFLANIFISQI
jgi:hypothetical protein